MSLVWIGAALVGLTLGLLGSGGSILTVPMLVYLAGEPDKAAIAESLAIVGSIALVGAIPYALQKTVNWRSVLLFGVPGILGTYLGAALSAYVSGAVQLVLFAVVMLLAAVMMFRGRRSADEAGEGQEAWKISAQGLFVGVLTGLLGVGGGFLIVPALVLFGGLTMRGAVGTSLFIIAMNSFSGFAKHLDVLASLGGGVDWQIVALFVGVGIVGSFVGNLMATRLPQATLRRFFAVFLVGMGVFILWQEVPGMLRPASATPPVAAVQPKTPDRQDSTQMFSNFFSSTKSKNLTPQQIQEEVQNGAALIDVRTPMEYNAEHLAGARNIDLSSPDFQKKIEALPKDKTYLLYCRSGARSGQAERVMNGLGYTVHNIGGLSTLKHGGMKTGR